MTAWIYILAWTHPYEDGPLLRFEHKVVMAANADEAYRKGAEAAKEAGLFPTPGPGNDYVIQLVAQ